MTASPPDSPAPGPVSSRAPRPDEPTTANRVWPAAAADLAGVLVFATIGRGSHAEGVTVSGVLVTAAPFLAGLLVGWGLARAWRAPRTLTTGTVVWAVTAVLGLLARAAFTHRLPLSFVLVASISLAVLLLGWRSVAALAARLSAGRVHRSAADR